MSLSSRTIRKLQDAATFLGETPWDWDEMFIGTSPGPLNSYVTPVAALEPEITRVTTDPHLFVSARPDTGSAVSTQFRDRCGRKWMTSIYFSFCIKFTEHDYDETQGVVLAEADKYVYFTEQMADFLDEHKGKIPGLFMQNEMTHVIFDRDYMVEDRMYVGGIVAPYHIAE